MLVYSYTNITLAEKYKYTFDITYTSNTTRVDVYYVIFEIINQHLHVVLIAI